MRSFAAAWPAHHGIVVFDRAPVQLSMEAGRQFSVLGRGCHLSMAQKKCWAGQPPSDDGLVSGFGGCNGTELKTTFSPCYHKITSFCRRALGRHGLFPLALLVYSDRSDEPSPNFAGLAQPSPAWSIQRFDVLSRRSHAGPY